MANEVGLPMSTGEKSTARRSLVIYLPDLSGGGAERLHARLMPYFSEIGFDVTFLLDRARGELMEPVKQAGARIVSLGATRQINALPKLVRFLKAEKPDILVANMEHMNVMAVLARRLAGVCTRIVVTQHNTFSEQVKRPSWQFRILPLLYRWAIPYAERIIAVSKGVADDLATASGVPRNRIDVIYNGVLTEDFEVRAAKKPDHPWFSEDVPVVLAMGRLVEQKDFATLIKAFAVVAERMPARLIILGEGPLRQELENMVGDLGLEQSVAMPGFSENAIAAIDRARLFVLSSRFEGFGNVVAEALACGTPVVSTDCPHGPAEILENGYYGALVPVGNTSALAEAILGALVQPWDSASLRKRGSFFSVAACARSYSQLFQ